MLRATASIAQRSGEPMMISKRKQRLKRDPASPIGRLPNRPCQPIKIPAAVVELRCFKVVQAGRHLLGRKQSAASSFVSWRDVK